MCHSSSELKSQQKHRNTEKIKLKQNKQAESKRIAAAWKRHSTIVTRRKRNICRLQRLSAEENLADGQHKLVHVTKKSKEKRQREKRGGNGEKQGENVRTNTSEQLQEKGSHSSVILW